MSQTTFAAMHGQRLAVFSPLLVVVLPDKNVAIWMVSVLDDPDDKTSLHLVQTEQMIHQRIRWSAVVEFESRPLLIGPRNERLDWSVHILNPKSLTSPCKMDQ